MKQSTKYPREKVIQAVKESSSYAEVMRRLDKKWSGGQQQNLKRWIEIYELDTSHFTGQAHQKGKKAYNKLHWSSKLVLDESMSFRQKSRFLREAMIESGIEYTCGECNQEPIWRGKEMTLQINHKNRNWKDNRKENLEFLCPNCHSTTEGWSGKSTKERTMMRK